MTAEPYHTEIAKTALKYVGGTIEDILFFYTYRSLLNSFDPKKDPLKDIDQKIEFSKNQLNVASTFDKYDFIRNYKAKMNTSSVSIDDKNVVPDFKGNYIQRLAKAVEVAHLDLLFLRIQKEQSTHKRVMMVYGPGIFFFQVNKLEDIYSGHIP